ncbi:glycosyltransferase family 59 protein [Cystobasidium minutum MCA 4210]|uniref:glycosyltransferase family 59 protein n=1 Tax=Cystobasidium minutum MCA 4210 TaxID=1397322 RepID=UPI0034CEBBF8|eukprot:jgi/Rhomi1/174486/fgenesh1_kg.8_\
MLAGRSLFSLNGFLPCGLVFALVNHIVREPYMDEIFHIGQAQSYIESWTRYDDKLTTPPGLYIPSSILGRYVTKAAVSVPALRFVNLVLLFCLPQLVADLLCLLRNRGSLSQRKSYINEANIISTFPLVYFFGFLYYTDVASLSLVLLAYRQALLGRYGTSALAGLVSLTIRQTNILWVAFIAFEALTLELDKTQSSQGEDLHKSNDLSQISMPRAARAIVRLVSAAAARPQKTIMTLAPYVPVAGAFLAFLWWNGGIVLGDKTMHVPVLHIPQLYYFSAFTAVMLVPYLLSRGILTKTLQTMVSSPNFSAALTAGIAYTISKYTIAHPFLLADNRHYTFYIWRRIINVHPYSRHLLSPAYLASLVSLWHLLAESGTWGTLPFLAYATVTTLTLVPSPLLEFRYFIVPFIMLRLHVKPKTDSQLQFESIIYTIINAVTIAMFLFRPFKWPSESGWQRFMW